MRQMTEGHGRHVRMHALGCGERDEKCRNLGINPGLVIETLKQLKVWLELPGDLPEDFVLFIRPREFGIGARLTVVIAQILISRKKPDPVAMHRSAEIRREVTVPDAFISSESLAARQWKQDRLTGQARRLPVVRRV